MLNLGDQAQVDTGSQLSPVFHGKQLRNTLFHFVILNDYLSTKLHKVLKIRLAHTLRANEVFMQKSKMD